MDKNNDILKLDLILEDGSKFAIPFREDGYIFATALCQSVGKRPKDWSRLRETKEITKILSNETSIPENKLIEVKFGGNKYHQGTWIHRRLATNLGQWCSVSFSVHITKWIEEWCQTKKNENKYLFEIYNLKNDNLENRKEYQIQQRLHEELGGCIEVETEVGYIDLLTDYEIIEIKDGKLWKHALGQILMYSVDYPNHKKRIHLFDIEKNKMIEDRCNIYNIKVSYE